MDFLKDISVQCVSWECKALHLKLSLSGFQLHRLNIYSPTYCYKLAKRKQTACRVGGGRGTAGRVIGSTS